MGRGLVGGKTCAIISGGEATALVGVEKAQLIIACDGGVLPALAQGIVSQVVIGDFDTYQGDLLELRQLVGVQEVIKLPADKDDTDTLAAVKYALASGYTDLVLYCALGGRLDHLIANLQVGAYVASNGGVLRIWDPAQQVWCFGNDIEFPIVFPVQPGYSFSLFALSDQVTGVTLQGAKYELQQATLHSTFPIGISNQWVQDEISLQFTTGIMAVVLSKL